MSTNSEQRDVPVVVDLASATMPRQSPQGLEASQVLMLLEQTGRVPHDKALEFVSRTACDTVQRLSMYLRLQLPPAAFATEEAIIHELRELFSTGRTGARALLRAIDITATFGALGGTANFETVPVEASRTDVSSQMEAAAPPEAARAWTSLHVSSITAPKPAPSDRLDVEARHSNFHDNSAFLSDNERGTESAQFHLALPTPTAIMLRTPRAPAKSGPVSGEVTEKGVEQDLSCGASSGCLTLRIPTSPDAVGRASQYSGTAASFTSFNVPDVLQDNNDRSCSVYLPHPASGATGGLAMDDSCVPKHSGVSPYERSPLDAVRVALQTMVPHYRASVAVQLDLGRITILALAALAFVIYIATRCLYISSGFTAERSEQGANVPYSWVVLAAELALGVNGFAGHQTIWRQTTSFEALREHEVKRLQAIVKHDGARQVVHVLVTTYSEPSETVKECVLRLLLAPAPCYMSKHVYVCDDGSHKSAGPEKRAMVGALRRAGFTNVTYIGGRVKEAHQLNGKSANLNHALLKRIYPHAKDSADVPERDIVMVMDCDHMVKTEVFMKMGAVMLHPGATVALVPQWFHNMVTPDCMDQANADFMFNKMPFYFGAGTCLLTGTNVMIRARALFRACAQLPLSCAAHATATSSRQLFSETEVSEDIELGSRLQAQGGRAVLILDKLVTGEVPVEPRSMWRQRLRWMKGGHTFIWKRDSPLFRQKTTMSLYQRSLYVIAPASHFVHLWAEPVLFTLPMMCLFADVCPFGLDDWLFYTHVARVSTMLLLTLWQDSWWQARAALMTKTASRVLWFASAKAAINAVLVASGVKGRAAFKFTPKAGVAKDEAAVTQLVHSAAAGAAVLDEGDCAGHTADANVRTRRGRAVWHGVRKRVSRATALRRRGMPYDGIWDPWVLLAITALNLAALYFGLRKLVGEVDLLQWDNGGSSLTAIGVVFGIVEATPGLLYLGYMATYSRSTAFLKLWVPTVTLVAVAAVSLVEIRLLVGFATGH